MILEERRYTPQEWNDTVMPAVESGTIQQIPDAQTPFMMIGQAFGGTLEESGKRFRCVGWTIPPTPYVDVRSVDAGEVSWTRASGDCICAACGEPYRKHPYADNPKGPDGRPFLKRLCDGTLVKL